MWFVIATALGLFAVMIFVVGSIWIGLTHLENEEKRAMLDDE